MVAYRRKRGAIKKRTGRRLKGVVGAARAAEAAGAAYRAASGSARAAGMRRGFRVRRVPTRSRTKLATVDGYNQFTTENKTYGRQLPAYLKTRRILNAAKEAVIYQFGGYKAFDDNGFYFMSNHVTGAVNALPCYALLLNGRNTGTGGTTCNPLKRLYINNAGASDGLLQWQTEAGIDENGALTNNLGIEYQPNVASTSLAGQKMFHDWSEVKLNLWGAKNKAIKWVVQIVRVTDDEVSPWSVDMSGGTTLTSEGQQSWLESLKQFTFNPISKIDIHRRQRIKVIRTWERVIQPTSSTENDADPHCHVLKIFSRFGQTVIYDRLVRDPNNIELTNDAPLYNGSNPFQTDQRPYSVYPDGKSQVFVLLRASAYVHNAEVSNAVYGSFDAVMRTKFTILD